MKIHYFGLLPNALRWVDVAILNASFLIAYFFRFDELDTFTDKDYINLMLVTNLVWIFTTYIFKTYSFPRSIYHFSEQMVGIVKATLLQGAGIMAFLYLAKLGEEYSRYQFLMTYGLFMFFSTITRYTAASLMRLYQQAGHHYSRYAIVGKGDLASLINKFYDDRKELGYQFYGTLELTEDSKIEKLESIVRENHLDYIYCCLSEMNDEQVRDIIRMGERQRTQIRLIPDFRGFMTNMAMIEYHDMYPVIQVNTKPFSSVKEQRIKRVFDLVFSAVVIIVGAPIYILIAIAVKLTSKGPIFYKQKRSGQWGEIFEIYKFRSMYIDSDQMGMQHSQGDSDARITPAGRILRKTRLDEIPQFFNVLKGEMSVVGPRPLFKYDVDMLMEAEPHDFQRLLTVKPGITSIGQVTVGYADNVTKNLERLKHDLEYLQSYSLFDDMQLIFRTVQVMFSGKGI